MKGYPSNGRGAGYRMMMMMMMMMMGVGRWGAIPGCGGRCVAGGMEAGWGAGKWMG